MTFLLGVIVTALSLLVLLHIWLISQRKCGIFRQWCKGMANLISCLANFKDSIRNKSSTVDSLCSVAKSMHTSHLAAASLCISPECIRCTRNLDILSSAMTKLSYYNSGFDIDNTNLANRVNAKADSKKKSEHNEYTSLVMDVKQSAEKAKQQKSKSEFLTSKNRTNSNSSSREDSIVKRNKLIQEPLVFHMSGLREKEFWSMNELASLTEMKEKWRSIALEFIHLYQSPLEETQELWKSNFTLDGKWEIAQLVDQGRLTNASNFCPLTTSFLKGMPDFLSDCYFGDASFSVIHPGTKISTHCGSTNCRIRCHIGLKVPKGECILTVGNQSQAWEEGELLCFDDSFPHSVHHSGVTDTDDTDNIDISHIRAVLMVDLWHPDITDTQRKMIRYAFGP